VVIEVTLVVILTAELVINDVEIVFVHRNNSLLKIIPYYNR
jgi:hypothetical protein